MTPVFNDPVERTQMSENAQTALLTIYNRLAPKFQIAGLNAASIDPSELTLGVELTTNDEHFSVILALYSKADNEDLTNHRWEYMDCMTGSIIKSDLSHTATDEEVIAFFTHTMETDDSVMKL